MKTLKSKKMVKGGFVSVVVRDSSGKALAEWTSAKSGIVNVVKQDSSRMALAVWTVAVETRKAAEEALETANAAEKVAWEAVMAAKMVDAARETEAAWKAVAVSKKTRKKTPAKGLNLRIDSTLNED